MSSHLRLRRALFHGILFKGFLITSEFYGCFIGSLKGKFNRYPCIHKVLADNHIEHPVHSYVFSESFLLPKIVLTAVDKTEAILTMEQPTAFTFIDF